MENLTEHEQIVLKALWSFSNPKSALFPTVVPAWRIYDRCGEMGYKDQIKSLEVVIACLRGLNLKGFVIGQVASVDMYGEPMRPCWGHAPTQKTIDMDMEILDEY